MLSIVRWPLQTYFNRYLFIFWWFIYVQQIFWIRLFYIHIHICFQHITCSVLCMITADFCNFWISQIWWLAVFLYGALALPVCPNQQKNPKDHVVLSALLPLHSGDDCTETQIRGLQQLAALEYGLSRVNSDLSQYGDVRISKSSLIFILCTIITYLLSFDCSKNPVWFRFTSVGHMFQSKHGGKGHHEGIGFCRTNMHQISAVVG